MAESLGEDELKEEDNREGEDKLREISLENYMRVTVV